MRMDTDSLKASLEALPKELYDEILDCTFTPSSNDLPDLACYYMGTFEIWTPDFRPSSTDRIIHASYKPPKFLQISRETRERYAQRYYGNGSIFYVGGEIGKSALAPIPKTHVDLISEIRWLGDDPEEQSDEPLASQWKERMRNLDYCSSCIPGHWLPIHISVFKGAFPCADGSTKWFSYWDLQKPSLEKMQYYKSLIKGTKIVG